MDRDTAPFPWGPRRAGWCRIDGSDTGQVEAGLVEALEEINLLGRALIAILYNCAPCSGHPGGSISASRMIEGLVYGGLDYDFSDPRRPDADVLVLAAGHKALGLYALWALRNEVVRLIRPAQLPDPRCQLRLEDLLGFRRSPARRSERLSQLEVKPLDGHPTPAVPFVPLATGASGVGVGAGFGLAFSALDLYPDDPPRVHIVEGEGGLTPGRVQEAMACASRARLHNAVLHLDWNQSSIDSDRVCRDGDRPGDYVQWDPLELARLHDFNAVQVADGLDHAQVLRAIERARSFDSRQPTAIIYRSVKGWRYGIEGSASHGAGHACCSEAFYSCPVMAELEQRLGRRLPRHRFDPADPNGLEDHLFDLLMAVREYMQSARERFEPLGERIAEAGRRLDARARRARPDGPSLEAVFDPTALRPEAPPPGLQLRPGERATLRGSLGDVLSELNRLSRGAVIVSAADLVHSTSIARAVRDFDPGFFDAVDRPGSRLVATGGICEDAMGAFLSAVGLDGRHLGAGASYGAFAAPLQHVSIRLHAIGQQARQRATGAPPSPYLLVCGHAGLKTGEDGPTHADPQCLQLLQENFPPGACICLTPWDPAELWPCVIAGLQARPAVLAVFVTRPAERIVDRAAAGLPPAHAASAGLYRLRSADPAGHPYHGSLVLQGSEVANTFVQEVLPRIDERGLRLNVFYVSSVELFDRQPEATREQLFPEARGREAMGITGFTLPTLYRWVRSEAGRRASLHPFRCGGFCGSGQAEDVLAEAGLDGSSQWKAVLDYAERAR
ncbi:MAG: hypothetical protein JXR96_10975 [Deltaproteobacteria bacterium]|nr:hypothetical protein [Deltaproteobacteria bacterium]